MLYCRVSILCNFSCSSLRISPSVESHLSFTSLQRVPQFFCISSTGLSVRSWTYCTHCITHVFSCASKFCVMSASLFLRPKKGNPPKPPPYPPPPGTGTGTQRSLPREESEEPAQQAKQQLNTEANRAKKSILVGPSIVQEKIIEMCYLAKI